LRDADADCIRQTINASLSTADCRFPDGTYYDEYTFTANSGQQIRIEMSSTDFDTYLFLFSPSDLNQPNINEPLAENDNISSTNTNSRIPRTQNVFITLAGDRHVYHRRQHQ
jgi:serine protease Do